MRHSRDSRLVARFPVGRILARHNGFRLGAEFKMLMFNDTGIRNIASRVIHDRNTLMVLFVKNLTLETKAAIFQRAQFEVIKSINRATVNRSIGYVGLF